MVKLIAILLTLASPSFAQVRISPVGSVGTLPIPLTPFNNVFTAPALSVSPLSSPSLSPIFSPSIAPALAIAVPINVSDGRVLFDGAAAKPDAPAQANPASVPSRGDAVSLNGTSLPSRMFSDQTSIAGHLIRAIDASKVSIDIAIHGLALREIAAALVRAKARGVKIRIVMNQTHLFPEKPRDSRTAEIQTLIDEGFDMKMLRGGDMFGVMHNKIAIFDAAVLETGSYNWTHAADAWHWENAMFLMERARVRAFQTYWDWLWSISSMIPTKAPALPIPLPEGAPRPPALPSAPQDPDRTVLFNGESFPAQAFSPGGVTAHLARAIDAARTSIDLANFSFTSEDLRDALGRAKARGVKIRIVFDAGQYKFLSEMHWFAENGFTVLVSKGKEGEKGVMHNKFAVLDGALVEAGSFNWTRNGERNNYENAMFLDAPDDVAAFAAYFERIHDQAWAPAEDDHAGPHAAPEGFDPDAH